MLAKTQHIFLNNASFEFDSQLDIQNQIQAIQTDITVKFQEIKNSIADLRFVNLPAANQLAIAESASQIIITIAAAKNAEKQSKTATKTADKTASKSYAQVAISNSQEQNWQLVQNKKKTATAANKAANANAKSASFSYREKRLILLVSKNQEIDFMKVRNQINQELEKQLKLAANKFVLAAITKSQIQQNIVLTTTDNYNADFLIQHEKIWSKFFKYTTTCKNFV